MNIYDGTANPTLTRYVAVPHKSHKTHTEFGIRREVHDKSNTYDISPTPTPNNRHDHLPPIPPRIHQDGETLSPVRFCGSCLLSLRDGECGNDKTGVCGAGHMASSNKDHTITVDGRTDGLRIELLYELATFLVTVSGYWLAAG